MTFLVVANFKSNLTQSEVKSWLKQVNPQEGIVIAPSFLDLTLFNGFTLAGQDVSPFPRGSYTGEVSADQLKELGVTYCLVGHSERRRYFHETSLDVANKVKELVSVGITPIICLDESDITSQFIALDSEYLEKCLYAYEPSEGIGGAQTATPEQIISVRTQIQKFSPHCRFIYGGSVTPQNLKPLLSLNLSGVLVGTVSLNPEKFLELVEVSHGL